MTAGDLRDLVRLACTSAFGPRGDAILARVDRWIWASVAFPPVREPDKTRDHELSADRSYRACAWCARGSRWADTHVFFRSLGGGRVRVFVNTPGGRRDYDPYREGDDDPTLVLCGPCVVLGAEMLAGAGHEVPDAMVFAEVARAVSATGSQRTEEAIAELDRLHRAPALAELRPDGRCRLCRGERVPTLERAGNRGTSVCPGCLANAVERYRFVAKGEPGS